MSHDPLPLLPLVLDDVPWGLRQALAQEGIPFCDRRPGAAKGRFVLFDSRCGPLGRVDAGQVAVDIDPLRHGLGEDPLESLLDERADHFRWEIAGLRLTEEIARVDKATVRRRLLGELRTMIEQAGGVWLRVSAFPFPYRSAFNFRIDYDRYDAADFDAVVQLIAGHEQATSHFVNGATYEPLGDELARLRGLDVGSHGYRHHTYRTLQENLPNVRRGIEVLREAGLEPSGFVAPHGRFNRGLLGALDVLAVGHSSEFGLAYDDLPFLPVNSSVLQIPAHPVSLGLFLEAAKRDSPGAAVEAAIAYFDQLARSRYRAGEPVFLYGHPTRRLGRYPEVLRGIFDTAGQFGAIWKTTLSRFAEWWRARGQIRMSLARRGDEFVLSVEDKPGQYAVGIEYCRGEHVALMPLAGQVLRFSPAALAYQRLGGRSTVGPVRIDPPEGLRGRVRRMIDWERVTPIEEISSGNWRNWAKRTLRRWRDAS